MSGTGNLLLKRKVGSGAVNASGVPVSGALPSCMPAIQLQGLSPVANEDKTSYQATNFANRMWVGAEAVGVGNSEPDDITGIPVNTAQQYSLPPANQQSYTRPIDVWVRITISHIAIHLPIVIVDINTYE